MPSRAPYPTSTGVAYQSAARIEQLAAQPLSGELSEEVERLEGALVELETQLRGLLRAPTNVS